MVSLYQPPSSPSTTTWAHYYWGDWRSLTWRQYKLYPCLVIPRCAGHTVVVCHSVWCVVWCGVVPSCCMFAGWGELAGCNARLLFLSGLSMITAHMINIHLWRMLGLPPIGWPRWDAAVIGRAGLANNRLNVAWLALWLSWYHHWPARYTTTTSFPHQTSPDLTRRLL